MIKRYKFKQTMHCDEEFELEADGSLPKHLFEEIKEEPTGWRERLLDSIHIAYCGHGGECDCQKALNEQIRKEACKPESTSKLSCASPEDGALYRKTPAEGLKLWDGKISHGKSWGEAKSIDFIQGYWEGYRDSFKP